MMPRNDNSKIVDLKKAQWAKFYYVNQWGDKREHPPEDPIFTIRNVEYHKDFDFIWLTADAEKESVYTRAKNTYKLDRWIPTCYLQLTANHSLIYSGDRALSIWNKWKAMQFRKKKGT